MGRRLRFSYDYCVELNLECRQKGFEKQTAQTQNETTGACNPHVYEEEGFTDQCILLVGADEVPDCGVENGSKKYALGYMNHGNSIGATEFHTPAALYVLSAKGGNGDACINSQPRGGSCST